MPAKGKTKKSVALGKKSRARRIKAGLTAEALAQEIGVRNNTVYHWEVGIQEPGKVTRYRIANALGIPVETLLDGAPETRALTLLRLQRGLRISEVAQALGVTDGTISSYENGRRLPHIRLVPKMARLYGLTIEELYDVLGVEK